MHSADIWVFFIDFESNLIYFKIFTLIPPPRSVPTGAVRRHLPHRARGLWTPLRRLPPPRTAACPDPSVTLSDLEGVCVCRETYHLNTEKGVR